MADLDISNSLVSYDSHNAFPFVPLLFLKPPAMLSSYENMCVALSVHIIEQV